MSFSGLELNGKTAVVIGGTSGIGRAIAVELGRLLSRREADAEFAADAGSQRLVGVAGKDKQVAFVLHVVGPVMGMGNREQGMVRLWSLTISDPILRSRKIGWGGRIRTYECRDQNPVP